MRAKAVRQVLGDIFISGKSNDNVIDDTDCRNGQVRSISYTLRGKSCDRVAALYESKAEIDEPYFASTSLQYFVKSDAAYSS